MIKDQQIKEWYVANKGKIKCGIQQTFGVEYVHLMLENKDDLYVTKYGLPSLEQLRPENYWKDEEWFQKNSDRLSGTSCVFKVRTKKVHGRAVNIVLKWNRMGQDIPGAQELEEPHLAEFNSPFEEFALVMELRDAMAADEKEMLVQKPLAIYVPYETSDLWQLGRKENVMRYIMEKHKEIELDMHRSYAVIYQWIEGFDLLQAHQKKMIEKRLVQVNNQNANQKISEKGFVVKDQKPQHVILRTLKNGKFKMNGAGDISVGLVDFELLSRTPEGMALVKREKRADYFRRQRERFEIEESKVYHPHLKHTKIFGVDYVYGRVESTRGRLWVVGKDPFLFDYFLPERWEQTPKTKISAQRDLYRTTTKDDISLVWSLSKVGTVPDMDPFKKDERRLLEYGYNSPFEEFSIALELNAKGIATVYPRAIYMSGDKTHIPKHILDESRYLSHKRIMTPDRAPALKRNHDYVVIWGLWNGAEDLPAQNNGDAYEGKDIMHAYREGVITQNEYFSLIKYVKKKLHNAGIQDLYLKGRHILIKLDNKGNVVRGKYRRPEIRICNFEFLKRRSGQ